MPLINAVFNKEEADIICKIPLSRYGQKDVMIWRGTTSGEFTVRSAYHLERRNMRTPKVKVLQDPAAVEYGLPYGD
jgi:hypothetical protein